MIPAPHPAPYLPAHQPLGSLTNSSSCSASCLTPSRPPSPQPFPVRLRVAKRSAVPQARPLFCHPPVPVGLPVGFGLSDSTCHIRPVVFCQPSVFRGRSRLLNRKVPMGGGRLAYWVAYIANSLFGKKQEELGRNRSSDWPSEHSKLLNCQTG